MSQPKLTRRLILERPVRIPDGAGGFREDWSALGVFWAEIRPKNAREPLSGLRSNARVTHKITFRSAAKNSPRRPTADQRLRTGNRIFAIHGVSEADDRDAYLTIWAEEGGVFMTYALAWPLQQGIFQQLTGDRTLHAMVGERIYDGTPPFGPEAAPEGPYITLGDDTAEDWSTVTGHGALHRVLISVYAPRRGFSDAKQVAGAVCDALIDAQIALSRGHVVNIGFLSAQSARLENDALRRIDMRFRITIEDTAI